MVPFDLLLVLIPIDFLLIIYGVWDHDNRVYGNVLACFLAAVLAFFIAQMSISGGVVDIHPAVFNVTTNTTLNVDTYVYEPVTIPIQDPPLQMFFIFVGVIMSFVTLLFIAEALYMRRMGDEEGEEEE